MKNLFKNRTILLLLLLAASCSSEKNPRKDLLEGGEALKKGQIKKAHSAYSRALENGGGNSARKGLAIIALKRGDIRHALAMEAEIRSHRENSEKDLIIRAQILERAGKAEKAAALYSRLLTINPKHPQGLFSMARYWIYRGNRKKAVRFLQQVTNAAASRDLLRKAGVLLRNLR